MYKKLGSLLLVLLLAVSMLTAIPVLGADYKSITLDQTITAMTVDGTSQAVVHGFDAEGTKTAITEGVSYSVASLGDVDAVKIDSTGKITAQNEGLAVLTAKYGTLSATITIVVGKTSAKKGYDTVEEATNFTVSWPRGLSSLSSDQQKLVALKDTTQLDSEFKRSGGGSLYLRNIDAQTQKDTEGNLLTDALSKAIVSSNWARISLFNGTSAKGVAELWFYDDGQTATRFWIIGMGAFPRADGSTGTTQSIRGNLIVDAKGYSFVKDGAAQPNPQILKTIPKSKGWHQMILDASSPDAYVIYIDGQTMYSYTEKGRNMGIPTIQNDRVITQAKHDMWLDDWAIYDITLTKAIAPVVSDVKVSGKAIEENTLTASFIYKDANGDEMTSASYTWEKSANGKDGWTDLKNNKNTYTLSKSDIGSYFRVGVVASNGAAENPNSKMVYSNVIGPVTEKPNTGAQNFLSVDLSHTKDLYAKGETGKIAITATSENGTYDLSEFEKVTYSMDDPYTATVSEDGTITAVADGYSILTATVTNADGSKVSGKLMITVSSAKNVQNFDAYTIPSPELNDHVAMETSNTRFGAQSLKIKTKTNSGATIGQWGGFDLYTGQNKETSMTTAWFYDTGETSAVDGIVPGTLYIQGANNRYLKQDDGSWVVAGTYTAEFYLTKFNVGVQSASHQYYYIQNHDCKAVREDVLPGLQVVRDIPGKDNTGYIGEPEKVGTFYTDGQNGMPLIKRTKGWHQVSVLADMGKEGTANIGTDKGSTKIFLDGELIFEEQYTCNGFGCVRAGSPAGGYGLYDDLSSATIGNGERPALVTDITMSGTAMVDKTVTATETVTDKNGDAVAASTYQWEVSADGKTKWTAVNGKTTSSYKFVNEDLGKYFRIAVTPHSTVAPVDGAVAYSDVVGPVAALKTEPWVEEDSYSVTGEGKIGQTLTANYKYVSDSETGDEQGATKIVWERADNAEGPYTPIAGATGVTYAPGAGDAGKYVRATITPVDVNGLEGPAVSTEGVKIDGTVEYFVATDGKDTNAGSEDAPFATIKKAKEVINASMAGGSVSADKIVVNIKGGTYVMESSLSFTAADSGKETCPIIYQAYNDEEVVLTTAQKLDATKIKKVTDKSLTGRLIEDSAKDKLYQLNLNEVGVITPALKANGVSGARRFYLNGVELINARWPNDDKSGEQYFTRAQPAPAGSFDATQYNGAGQKQAMQYVDDENRSAKWQIKSGEAFFGGAVAYLWARTSLIIDTLDAEKKIVKSSTTSSYGQNTYTAATERYLYFENLFEEIDMPGESYIDREKNILYFYPVGDMENPEITLGGAVDNLINVNGASYITFKGINVKQNGGAAYNVASSSKHITIEDATISNISGAGIKAEGSNVTIEGCHLYDISGNAILLKGGNRETLTSSGNVVTNNKIHGGSGIADAIQINGVGHVISHNEIFEYDMGALRFTDTNNLLIEYNKIYDVQLLNADGGALYWGRNPSEMGNIVRYNYFYDIGGHIGHHGQQSIFTDDGQTGPIIYGNIFYHGGLPQFPLKTNGGVFHHVYNNLIIDNEIGFYFQDWGRSTTGVTNGLQYTRWWLYVQDMGDAYEGSNTNMFVSNRRKSLMFSDVWKDYYTNKEETGWWAKLFNYINEEMYTEAKALYDEVMAAKKDGDNAKIKTAKANFTKWMSDNLPAEHMNLYEKNVLINVPTSSTGFRKEINNLSLSLEEGKKLFEAYGTDFDMTSEGLAKVRQTISDFPDLDFDAMGTKDVIGGTAPVAKDAFITGTPAVKGILTAKYSYSDADGDKEGLSKIYWYVSDSENGIYERITEGYGKNFTVSSKYEGKYIRYEVLPRDVKGIYNEPVASQPIYIGVNTTGVDKTALWEAITEVADALEKAVVGEEPGQYPQSAVDKLTSALEDARAVANDSNAYTFLVEQTTAALENAYDVFKNSANSLLSNVDADKIPLNLMLKDQKNWKVALTEDMSFTEDGSLVFGGASNTLVSYIGKKFANTEFSFKFKAEIPNPNDSNAVNSWVGIYLRQDDTDGMVWTGGRTGFMVDLKQHLIQLQKYPTAGTIADSILNDKKIVMGQEYVMTVGLFDLPDSEKMLFVLTMDGETIYSKEVTYDDLYGTEGYLAFNAGNNTKVTISPIYADTEKLEEAVANAESFMETVIVGDGYGEYSEEIIDALNDAIAEAKKLAENEDAAQSDVDAATLAVRQALIDARNATSAEGKVAANGEVAINYNHPTATLNVEKGVSDVTVKLDQARELPEIKIVSKDMEMTIPAGTVVADDFKAPLLGSAPGGNFAAGEVSKVYGEGSELVATDVPVRIVLKGEAGKNVAYKAENGKYTLVLKSLKADSVDEAIKALDGQKYLAVKVEDGNDLVVYSYGITELVTYEAKTESPTPTPDTEVQGPITGGQTISLGGGGGGAAQKEEKPSAINKFTDIIGHWAEADINDMADKGIVSGVTATTFEPDRSITRAEFAALVARALKLTAANDDAVFSDVSSDAWYKDAVSSAAAAGLVAGYEGKFRPDDTITREEMAVVIMKAYQFLGKAPLNGKLSQFADKDEISQWAVDYVDGAVSSGLISGMSDDTFAPKENATRAQVASLIKRLLK